MLLYSRSLSALTEWIHNAWTQHHASGTTFLWHTEAWLRTYTPSLSTLIFEEGLQEELLRDMGDFFQEVNTSKRRHCRGYLFHGPPGTGKTSLAKIAATHLRQKLYIIEPANCTDESLKIQALAASPGVILIDDIDAIRGAHRREVQDERKESERGISISAIFALLDGQWSKPGTVFILTTNFRDKLVSSLHHIPPYI